MRLELNIHHVRDLTLGAATRLVDGVLTIEGEELRRYLLEEDGRLADITFELAHPGERCRITSISDIVEPRAKLSGGVDFPGVLGRLETAGTGSAAVLRGMAVTILNPEERVGGRGAVLDMGGSHREGWTAQ